jgi:DNA-binding MarR family transcriptional regulator
MGYHKNKRKKADPFVMLDIGMLHSEEWKKLTHSEMLAYVYLRSNCNGKNNGEIPLTYSKLKGILASATLSKALKGLEAKKWIKKTTHGGLYRYYCLYKLTGNYDPLIDR